MSIELSLQQASRGQYVPLDSEFHHWAEACIAPDGRIYAVTIRIVGTAESQLLNHQYRGKKGPTNVLSFPTDLPAAVRDEMESESGRCLLGDLVICAGVVNQEAALQHKEHSSHWAHMTVHGILHLLGFDHQQENQALEMENREKEVLSSLGFSDPYAAV